MNGLVCGPDQLGLVQPEIVQSVQSQTPVFVLHLQVAHRIWHPASSSVVAHAVPPAEASPPARATAMKATRNQRMDTSQVVT
jgi:hypothetical protein